MLKGAGAKGKQLGQPKVVVDASRIAILRAQKLSCASIRKADGSSGRQPQKEQVCNPATNAELDFIGEFRDTLQLSLREEPHATQ